MGANRQLCNTFLLPTPPLTERVTSPLALLSGAGALCLGGSAYYGGAAPGGCTRRVDVPIHLCDKTAAQRIGLLELVLLRLCQVPAQIYNRMAQFNKDMIGQG